MFVCAPATAGSSRQALQPKYKYANTLGVFIALSGVVSAHLRILTRDSKTSTQTAQRAARARCDCFCARDFRWIFRGSPPLLACVNNTNDISPLGCGGGLWIRVVKYTTHTTCLDKSFELVCGMRCRPALGQFNSLHNGFGRVSCAGNCCVFIACLCGHGQQMHTCDATDLTTHARTPTNRLTPGRRAYRKIERVKCKQHTVSGKTDFDTVVFRSTCVRLNKRINSPACGNTTGIRRFLFAAQ